jgi:hypothetical protein
MPLRSRPLVLLAVFAAALLATACGSGEKPTSPRSQREIGALQLVRGGAPLKGGREATADTALHWSTPPEGDVYVAPRALEIPDTVAAGTPVRVTVTTVGPNGCWSAAGMEIRQESALVELTPMDQFSGAEVCTEILGYLSRSVDLTFTTPGAVTVRATGRLVGVEGDGSQPVTVERTVLVQ